MSFARECVDNKTKPSVFLVNKFLLGQNNEQKEGSLSEYPEETRQSFEHTFKTNLSLFMLKTANTPSSKDSPLLFEFRPVDDIVSVPHFLGAGDIVLAFVFFPSLYQIDADADTLKAGISDIVKKALDDLSGRFKADISSQWQKVVDPAYRLPKDPSTVPGETGTFSEVGQSLSTQYSSSIKLRKGGKVQKMFYSYKVGVVDVGHPAADSVFVWANTKDRKQMLSILGQPEVTTDPKKTKPIAFGPKAVARVASMAGDKKGEYLKSVGRGLAYNLLHEFWHVTSNISDHPVQGNIYIEAAPSPTLPRPDTEKKNKKAKDVLTLTDVSIKKIRTNYQNGWCKYIIDERKGIGDIKS
jgi:hypothetical protein